MIRYGLYLQEVYTILLYQQKIAKNMKELKIKP